MVFIGHLFLAFIAIAGLYLGATYSSLRYEINELIEEKKVLDACLRQREVLLKADDMTGLLACEREIAYYAERYNENAQSLTQRQKSIFAVVLTKFFKGLDHRAPAYPPQNIRSQLASTEQKGI
jgi:hypothetical protein